MSPRAALLLHRNDVATAIKQPKLFRSCFIVAVLNVLAPTTTKAATILLHAMF